MEDIIIDDRRQVSAKALNREKKAAQARGRYRSFGQYVADVLIKGLIVAALAALDFVLFAKSGSYSIFTDAQTINIESLYLISGLAILFFLINFLLSFSRFLQNLWVAVVSALFLLAIMNQFALFDKGSILANSFSSILTAEALEYFNYYSHIILAVAAGLVVLVFTTFAGRMTQTYILGILLFIFGWNFLENYFNPTATQFKTLYDNPTVNVAENKSDQRFIYIAMPGLTSVDVLNGFSTGTPAAKQSTSVKTAIDAMLGFYTQNNFTLYANAYTSTSYPFLNLVTAFNPSDHKENYADYTLSNVLLRSYWNFDELHTPMLYLKSNKMFNHFRKDDYQLKVYENHGVETCYVNNEIAVSKCIKSSNLPFAMDDMNLTAMQKGILLFDQWLESTGLVADINQVNSVLQLVLSSQNFPAADFNYQQFSIVNSFKTLDVMAHEIDRDEGKNAYFAIIDMPADLYIYDSDCKIKPISRWISADSTNAQQKKDAYAEQITCMIGQLENFIQNLTNSGAMRDTTIVIHGLNTPKRMTAVTAEPFEDIVNRTVSFAIYRPSNDQPSINNEVCNVDNIINSLIKKDAACQPYDDMGFANQIKDELNRKFAQIAITDKQIKSALPEFFKWYDDWAKVNSKDNNLSNLVNDKSEDSTQSAAQSENTSAAEPAVSDDAQLPDQEVKPAPVASKVEELEKEAPTVPLPALETDADDSSETIDKATEPEAAQPQPDAAQTSASQSSETSVKSQSKSTTTSATKEVKVVTTTEKIEVSATTKQTLNNTNNTIRTPDEIERIVREKKQKAAAALAEAQKLQPRANAVSNAKINLDIKVTDNVTGQTSETTETKSHDVIPPFLDDTDSEIPQGS